MHNIPQSGMRFSILLLWIGLCSFFTNVGAQELNWKTQHVSIEDGLSNRFVNAILQDDRGFMWIGTNFGLNRYDGHHFDILTKENSVLQSNSIYGLCLDYKKNIWVIHRDVKISPLTAIDVIDP